MSATVPPPDAAASTTGASVMRGGAWTLVSGLLPQVFALVLSVAAARFLEPAGMGRQSYIAFVSLSAATVFTSGVALALMRSVAESLGRRSPGDVLGLVAWGRRVVVVGALAGGAVLGVPAVLGSEPTLAWTLAAVGTTLGILQSVPNAVLLGAQRFRTAATIGLVTGGAAVPATIAVLALGGGISGMFAVEVVMVIANLIWTSVAGRRVLAEVAPGRPAENAELRRATARFAVFSTAGAVLTLVVWRRSEFFFLAHYSSDADIALYSIAFAAAAVLAAITEKLASVMGSAFATVHGAGAADRLRGGYFRALRLLTLLSLPVMGLAAGAGPAAIRLVYGTEYAEAGDVLLVLLASMPLLALWSVGTSLLVAVGDAQAPLVVGVAAAVVNVALAVVLVPRYDAVGAGIANSAGQVAAALATAYAARRHIHAGVPWDASSLVRAALASAAAGVVIHLIADGHGVPGLIGGLAAGLLVLAAASALLRPLSAGDGAWLAEHSPAGDRLRFFTRG